MPGCCIEPLESRVLFDGQVFDFNVLEGERDLSGNLPNPGSEDIVNFELKSPAWIWARFYNPHPVGTPGMTLLNDSGQIVAQHDSVINANIDPIDTRPMLPAGKYSLHLIRTAAVPPWVPTEDGYDLALIADAAGGDFNSSRDITADLHPGRETAYTDWVGTIGNVGTDAADVYKILPAQQSSIALSADGLQTRHVEIWYDINSDGLPDPVNTALPDDAGRLSLAVPEKAGVPVYIKVISDNFQNPSPAKYTLALRPNAAQLSISTTNLAFDPLTIRHKVSKSLVIQNLASPGSGNLSILRGSIQLSDPSQFSIGRLAAFTLAPGRSKTIKITFQPTPPIQFGMLDRFNLQASLVLNSNDPTGMTTIQLSGTALAARPINFRGAAYKPSFRHDSVFFDQPGVLYVANHFMSDSGVTADLVAPWAPPLTVREVLQTVGSSEGQDPTTHDYFLPQVFWINHDPETIPSPPDGFTESLWSTVDGGLALKSNGAQHEIEFTDHHGYPNIEGTLPTGNYSFGIYTTLQRYEYILGSTIQTKESNTVTSENWTLIPSQFGPNLNLSSSQSAIIRSVQRLPSGGWIYYCEKNGVRSVAPLP